MTQGNNNLISILFLNLGPFSEKNRVPSWTDRILYKGDGIKPIRYSSIAIDISDHKPVVLELMIKMSV